MFVQGYDITDEAHLAAVLDEADAKVGIDRLGAVHVNDAAVPLGSCRDRHANIGKGEMGKRGLAAFLSEPRFEGLPATLETPGPEKKGSSTSRSDPGQAPPPRRPQTPPELARPEALPSTPTARCRAGESDGDSPRVQRSSWRRPSGSASHPLRQATRTGLAGPCSPAVSSLFDVDAGDRAGDDQALDL